MKKVWNGLHYDVAGLFSQNHADKDGCTVFDQDGNMGVLKILAHDEKEAEDTYREELLEHPDYCDECGGWMNCFCELPGEEEDED